jgi:hypothetical protein
MTKDLEEIQSYIGTDIGAPHSSIAARAPNSARLVARVSWSWSPAHSRTDEYRIATDRARTTWNLYDFIQHYDTGKRIGSRIVTGSPYRGVSATRAAYQLLKTAWMDEIHQFDFDPSGISVDEEGLLSEENIAALAAEVKWLSSSSWLQLQSEQSLAELRNQLPIPLGDESCELLESVEACADDLGLNQDFLHLCSHYTISPSALTEVLEPLLQEATVVREQRRLVAEANVDKFRRDIDQIISQFSDQPGRYPGGGSITSPRQRVKGFIENYVGKHGELPTGRHKVPVFGPELDFDTLRREMGW